MAVCVGRLANRKLWEDLPNTEFRPPTSPHSTVRIGLAGEWVTLLVAPAQSLGFESRPLHIEAVC